MDLEQELSLVQEIDVVESAEIKETGILVTFDSSVESYLEGLDVLKNAVTDEEVEFYSNMGDLDESVILLEY